MFREASVYPGNVGLNRVDASSEGRGRGFVSEVFISYDRTRAAQASKIAEARRLLGHGVWRDDELPAHCPRRFEVDNLTKSIVRRGFDRRFATRWFVGDGFDIGFADDRIAEFIAFFPLIRSVHSWNKTDDFATYLPEIVAKPNLYLIAK